MGAFDFKPALPNRFGRRFADWQSWHASYDRRTVDDVDIALEEGKEEIGDSESAKTIHRPCRAQWAGLCQAVHRLDPLSRFQGFRARHLRQCLRRWDDRNP